MRRFALATVSAIFVTTAAWAEEFSVTNYSWLQLPPTNVTAFVGSTVGSGGETQFGPKEEFRWGFRCWIPTPALTGTATADFWAGLTFGKPRNVQKVYVRWYLSASATLKRFIIEGSTDGASFDGIATNDYGSFQTADGLRTLVTVTPGTYKSIRVMVKAGDYTGSAAAYAQPGLWEIQPVGDGVLDEREANYASGPAFGTTTANNNLSRNGLSYNTGFLVDGGSGTGDQPNWTSDKYAQVDLKKVRLLNKVVVRWQSQWGGSSYNVRYSVDGTTFTNVPNQSAPTQYAPGNGNCATEVRFTEVPARYIRITDAVVGGAGWALFDQILAYGVPPPRGTVMLLR